MQYKAILYRILKLCMKYLINMLVVEWKKPFQTVMVIALIGAQMNIKNFSRLNHEAIGVSRIPTSDILNQHQHCDRLLFYLNFIFSDV